jgi:predicted RNase H-like HicB family nuclease
MGHDLQTSHRIGLFGRKTNTPATSGENEGRRVEGPFRNKYKVVIEKYADGYLAYPLGVKGVVVGEGNSCEEALAYVKSAIRFHIETFGRRSLKAMRPCWKCSWPKLR